MRRARVSHERELAAGGRRRPVGDVRPDLGRHARERLLEQRRSPQFARRTHHGCLLFDLAVPAKESQARGGLGAIEELAGLALHGGDEPRVVARVVHVGERVVLPHDDSELVARVVERVVLVEERPADADHVHPRRADGLQRRSVGFGASGQRHCVDGRPAGPAQEDLDAVDAQSESARFAQDLELPEGDCAEIDDDPLSADRHDRLDRITGLRSVGVWPPSRRVRERHRALGDDATRGVALPARQRAGRGPDSDHDRLGCRPSPCVEGERDVDDPRVSLHARPQVGTHRRQPCSFFERDRAPRTDRGRGGRPCGNAPQQGGAYPAKLLRLDESCAPARPWAPGLEGRRDRAAAHHELVPVAEQAVHRNVVLVEHVVGLQDGGPVQPDLGDGGEPTEAKDACRRDGGLRRERAAPPPVGCVEVDTIIEAPARLRLARPRRRSTGPRAAPVQPRLLQLRRACDLTGGGGRELPPLGKRRDPRPSDATNPRHSGLPRSRAVALEQQAASRFPTRGQRRRAFPSRPMASWCSPRGRS